MANHKKYFMILDTETCGDLVFDFGYKVIDRKGNMVAEGSFVCSELMDDPYAANMFTNRFTKTKIAQYYYELYANSGAFTCLSFECIRDTINLVQKTFNAAVCAYNASFDMHHLNLTAQSFGYDKFFKSDVTVMDIWGMALSTLCNSRNYLKFCAKNDFLTAKGHPQTGAECVYRYIIQDTNFEEKHTAREDCEIETIIFMKILRRKCKFDAKIVAPCCANEHWQHISKKFTEF